jgi:hypothetical protein
VRPFRSGIRVCRGDSCFFGLKLSLYRIRTARSEAFAEKLFIATSAPEGVIEKKALTARLKASPDTKRQSFS